MLPHLKTIHAGLRRTTEALAAALGAPRPDGITPDWNALEWRLAMAAAVAHGVSPLLCASSMWDHAPWRSFLESQRAHVAQRHKLIAALLERLDDGARAGGLPIVALKGSALHALAIYRPGERPMADIDLLVREREVGSATALLQQLGYGHAYDNWKHGVFKPAGGRASLELGEHRDNQISIELHTCIREPLPVSYVDVSARIFPARPIPGLNPYPSTAALMSHLLLHTAGNIRSRSLRLLHLNDIARLAAHMLPCDWNALFEDGSGEVPWWALPPLRLTSRYYPAVIPDSVMKRLESACPPVLRMLSARQTLTHLSCSGLWIQSLPGIEWSGSLGEAARYLRHRIAPTAQTTRERLDSVRAQPWLVTQSWASLSRRRQILVRLTRPVPRIDTLHLVRAACEAP